MTIIKSAGVKDYGMKVDSQGRGIIQASIEAEDRHINSNNGKVWSADIDGIAINAGQYIAYFQNTSQVFYHMTDMRAHCLDAASIIDVDEVTVGTVGGQTPFAPGSIASRNIGVSSNPVGDMAYATAATGITGLTKVANIFHSGSLDNQTSHLRTTSNIIIPPGAALAVKIVTANATNGVTATWSIVEVDHEVN